MSNPFFILINYYDILNSICVFFILSTELNSFLIFTSGNPIIVDSTLYPYPFHTFPLFCFVTDQLSWFLTFFVALGTQIG